jgi:pyruvate,water dikinase
MFQRTIERRQTIGIHRLLDGLILGPMTRESGMTNQPALALALREIGLCDRARFGGKAAALGHLMAGGIPVPSGFAFSAGFILKHMSPPEDLDKLVATLTMPPGDYNTMATTSDAFAAKARSLLDLRSLQNDLCAEVDPLAPERFAVRSSAVIEDSLDASWAGQFSSFLDVTREDLANRVADCWSSLFSPRSITYANSVDKLLDPTQMAVIVQEMVPATTAGVAFSVAPAHFESSTGALYIEAVRGTCEDLASGRITPSGSLLDRATLTFRPSRHIPPHQQTINGALVQKVGALTLACEQLFGHPVDVEWAAVGVRCHVVQCRPITRMEIA